MGSQGYGTTADWLLCLAVIIALEVRLPLPRKNPAGHSPRYWRRHPDKVTPSTPSIQPPEIPKQGTLRLDVSLGLVAVVLAIFIVMFPPTTEMSVIGWVCVIAACAYYPVLHFISYLLHVSSIESHLVTMVAVLAIAVICAVKVWPPDALTASVTGMNIGGREGEPNLCGIEWHSIYKSTRIEISDIAEFPLQSVYLTIRIIPNKGDTLMDVCQMTDVSDVRISPGQFDLGTNLELNPADGNPNTHFSLQDIFDYAAKKMTEQTGNPGLLRSGSYYTVFCPRLTPETKLRLLVASVDKDKDGPRELRLVAHYEYITSSGIRAGQFDRILTVRR